MAKQTSSNSTFSMVVSRLNGFRSSVWFFPFLILIPLIVLTALKITGSSVGVYSMLNGVKDPDAITVNYRGVRSDEWLVSTQMIVAQANNNFERINQNIADGQDMSLLDVPYKDWSTILRPQNLVFFILPLEYAFAFKWWLLGVILVLSAYFFILQIFPKRYLKATLIATFIGLSPMMFWWYSTGITLCIAYCLLSLGLAIKIFKTQGNKSLLGLTTLLAYVLSCFAILLYPPFQIPCAIASAAFFIGYILELNELKNIRKLRKNILYLLLAAVVSAMVAGTFLYTRSAAIERVTGTVYPGARQELSGGVSPLLIMSSFLSPNLVYEKKMDGGYLRNQSEASNFIFIAPYLFLPSFYLIYRLYKNKKKILWGLVFTDVVLLFLIFRMYISTPWLESFYKLFFFNQIPSTRLLIGIGLAGVFQLILIIKALEEFPKFKKNETTLLAAIGGLSSFITMVAVGIYTIRIHPEFISSVPKVIVFSGWITLGIILLLKRRIIAGLLILVAFSALSVYKVNPVYQGLDPLTNAEPINLIKTYPEDGSWIVLDERLFINFPLMAGRDSLNSVQFYPQLDLWDKIDPDEKYENVYNRYAHVVFSADPKQLTPFELKAGDLVHVKFQPCSPFFQNNITYVLTFKELTEECVALDKSMKLPGKEYFVYKLTPPLTP